MKKGRARARPLEMQGAVRQACLPEAICIP